MKENKVDVMGRACLWLSGFAGGVALTQVVTGDLLGLALVPVCLMLALAGRR